MIGVEESKFKLIDIVCLLYVFFSIGGFGENVVLYVRIFLFICWTILLILERSLCIRLCGRKEIFFLILFFLVFGYLCILSTSLGTSIKYICARILLFSGIPIGSYYILVDSYVRKRTFLISSLLVWNFFVIRAIAFYIENPRAARTLAANQEAYGNIAIGGGYVLAYGAAILGVYLLNVILSGFWKEKHWKKTTVLLLIVIFILNISVVFLTASTVTILGTVLGIVLSIYINIFSTRGENRKISIFIGYVLFICVIVILFLRWNEIGEWIVNKMAAGDTILYQRFQEIGLAMIGQKGESEDLNYRLNSLGSSLKLFFQHPLFGSGYLNGFQYSAEIAMGIGGHGEIFDTMARYGLLGGVPLLLSYYYMIKHERRYSNGFIWGGHVVTFLFLVFFNPFVSFQGTFAIGCLVTVMSNIISRYERGL